MIILPAHECIYNHPGMVLQACLLVWKQQMNSVPKTIEINRYQEHMLVPTESIMDNYTESWGCKQKNGDGTPFFMKL